ncbi:tif471 [Symbiodinium natans]|uniref:Tif471 protein n=1 Tax=Symbiodinium natans TaxID=878477 RepID=A0A812RN19_9DINO|nr:tif471 [Symbiodinium natans]
MRIDTVLAVSEKLRWMSDVRIGNNTSLSAGATEFVPAAPFAGRSTKAAAYAALSPTAAEFLPEGDARQWGWNGSWSQSGTWTGGSWPGQGYSTNGGDINGWAGAAASPTCWFNDDAYSTDSSHSDSEPEADADEAQGGAELHVLHQACEVPNNEIAGDDDDFDSFSEDDGVDASLPRTATSDGEAEHVVPSSRVDVISKPACAAGVEGSDDGPASEEKCRSDAVFARSREELVQSCTAEELQASGDKSIGCKYDIRFMLAMRPPVADSETSLQLPRCEQVRPEEDVPDFLRRREDSEPNEEESWRATRSGEASKNRSRTAQDSKQTKSDKSDRSTKQDAQASAMKLEVSDNSWAAQIARRKALSKESSDDSFVKNMRSVLNKLTVEKFDTLSDQIIDLVSQSDRPNHGIPLLMQLVFEKATTQHHFINMYVGLCVKLHKWLTDSDHIDGAESQSNFKRVLLNQCQSSFEQYLEPPEGFDGLTGDELYEAQVKYKTKMLGNIRLVGELIRHGMLAPKIAIAVASELARDDPAVRSERLETLATFLETVGVALDDPSWKHHHELEMVFEEVVRACSDDTVPRRVRCLLQDVLDLRNGGWKSKRRKDLSKETPQTLAQVHEKAKADQVPRRDTSKSFSSCRAEVSSSPSWTSVRDLGRQL